MLTLEDINEVSFGRARFDGYKHGDVDDFIDEVILSFQQLTKEKEAAEQRVQEMEQRVQEMEDKNSSMQKKLTILAEKVESYRGDEDGIKDAVLSAHKMAKMAIREAEHQAGEIIEDAKRHADKIMNDAKNESEEMLSGARNESARKAKLYAEQVVTKKNELDQLKKQVTAFRSSLMELYKKHLEMINHIPNFRVKEEESVKSAKSVKEEASSRLEVSVNEDEYEFSDDETRKTEKYESDDIDYDNADGTGAFRVEIPDNLSPNTNRSTPNRRFNPQEYVESSPGTP